MNPENNLEDELLGIFNLDESIFSYFGMLGNSHFTLLYTFYCFLLIKRRVFVNSVIAAFTPENKQENINNTAKGLLSRYFIGIIIEIAAITIIVSTGLSFLEIQHVILIGFLAELSMVCRTCNRWINWCAHWNFTDLQLSLRELLPYQEKYF